MKRSILRWCVDFQDGFANVSLVARGQGWKFRVTRTLGKEFVATSDESADN
ncbi:hypothetical protein OAE63_00320 [bacterium]|nr:hypothetical protein [bacterium]